MKEKFFVCLIFLPIILFLNGCSGSLDDKYQSGPFITTKSMGWSRNDHSAVLLNNGNVLITGGYNSSCNDLESAEIYYPSSGEFKTIGKMHMPHIGPSILLPSGKVLIMDGYRGEWYCCELYDPETNSFSVLKEAGSLSYYPFEQTATLLQDGNVLIAGYGNKMLLNPETGAVEDLTDNSNDISRVNHCAVLLNDGRVLIVGGREPDILGEFEETVLIYDPSLKTFTNIGPLLYQVTDRIKLCLIDNGKVLIYFGTKTQLFDPATGKFQYVGNPIHMSTATSLSNHKVLITAYNESSQLYDPTTNTFKIIESMVTSRYNETGTLLPNGDVLIAGGYNQWVGELSSAEIYRASYYK